MKNKIVRSLPLITLVSMFFLSSCKKENKDIIKEPVKDTVVYLGQPHAGGIVAYILRPGDPGYDSSTQHGLIAAPSDLSTGIQWYNGVPVTTGATGVAKGTGNSNTNLIVASQGPGFYAAKLCADLVLNGYSDWYLPSKDELSLLYINNFTIGGFSDAYYWSSTEYDVGGAYDQLFQNGFQYLEVKAYEHNVRAIRSF